eukprot:11192571-Lingulodinium_polyedra.AAC.1
MEGLRWDPGLHAVVVETTPADADADTTLGDAQTRAMRRRQPTWAAGAANEEAWRAHSLAGATVALACR